MARLTETTSGIWPISFVRPPRHSSSYSAGQTNISMAPSSPCAGLLGHQRRSLILLAVGLVVIPISPGLSLHGMGPLLLSHYWDHPSED